MKYPTEVIEAARVLVEHLGAVLGVGVTIPPELVEAAITRRKGPTPADLMNLWNSMRDPRLKPCMLLTALRRRHCAARLKEFPDREDWEAFIQCINKNDWLLGVTPSQEYPDWQANFDWFIRPGSMVKFMEGGYRKNPVPAATARDNYGAELERRDGGG